MNTDDPILLGLLAAQRELANARALEPSDLERARYADAAAELARLFGRRVMRLMHEQAAEAVS